MRIITGSARGMKLETLEGENTRPTSERVKEAVFSMLQFEIEGREVLDVFSGSGQMGLEALSRGAAKATLNDAAPEAYEIIKRNAQKTRLFNKCVLLRCDYKELIRKAGGREKYDIVFLDPPYSSGYLPDALKRITEAEILKPGAFVVCESGEDSIPQCSLEMIKHVKYGRAYVTIFTNRKENEV